VLDSLATTNCLSPRPHPIDPAVFFDLVTIRNAVDEATSLAVRAQSSLHPNHSLHHLHNPHPNHHGGTTTTKLSRERKHRMRELATTKLSQAYHVDEIAASVAAMQSASTLDQVAHHVLQRCPADADARYVHFFHEKIPSRMMAQCTPLDTLDAIIADRPHDASPLRTRALTRLFKSDYAAAARDLSDALSVARYHATPHRQDLVLARPQPHRTSPLSEADRPSSLEAQLLFHRAGVYFALACEHVPGALDGLRDHEEDAARRAAQLASGDEPPPYTPDELDAIRRRADARRQLRQNAKRALRDYLAFLAHFDYTPGISADVAEQFLQRLAGANGHGHANDGQNPHAGRLLDDSRAAAAPMSDALVPHRRPHRTPHSDRAAWPKLPLPEVYRVSQLFDAVPPAAIPPYPAPTPASPVNGSPSAAALHFSDSHESVTYHPLLTDALHSLLLCHSLLQTPQKELLRHAYNAARIARICDGYPIFLAARSPARADWIEVLRRAGNWIGLQSTWEHLCQPAPLSGYTKGNADKNHANPRTQPRETDAQRRERQKNEAILEALADERVVDEESFQRAVRARERRFRDDEAAESRRQDTSPHTSMSASGSAMSSASSAAADTVIPKRWAQTADREYPISSERADAVARWIRDAPTLVESTGTKKRRTKGKGKEKKPAVHASGSAGLESSVASLSVQDVQDHDDEIDE
jgi:hypothetical protein